MLALRRRGRYGLFFIDGNADFFQPEAEPNGEGASMDLALRHRLRPGAVWADMSEGALYIWHRPPLLWLLAAFAVATMAGAPGGVIVPLLVMFNLAADWAARGYTFETALALLGVASGLGGVIGGLLVSTWGGLKRKRVYGVLIPMMLAGTLQIVYGLSPFLLVSAAAASLGAAMHPLLNAHSQSIWQSHTPESFRDACFQSAVLSHGPSCPLRPPQEVRSPGRSILDTCLRVLD